MFAGGYHYLGLYVLLSTSFSQLLRLGQRNGDALLLGAVNYSVAAAASAVMFLLGSRQEASWFDGPFVAQMLLGAFNGTLYFGHLLVLLAAFSRAGVGISIAVTSSGVAVPVLVSWLMWDEPMGLARWMAIVLLPPAMFLMRPRAPVASRPVVVPVQASMAGAAPASSSRVQLLDPAAATAASVRRSIVSDLLLLGSFLISGVVSSIHKAQAVYFGQEHQARYQAALFAAAAITSAAYVICHRIRGQRQDLALGTAVGLVNAINTRIILLGLELIPAVIFFPTSSCLIIVVSVLVSRLFWNEKPSRRQLAGVVVAMLIVVLVNV